MEINQVNEVMEKEAKLPKPIRLKTKTGETIIMEATTNSTYDKSYYASNGEIRRVKHVKLPVSLDKLQFTNVNELFRYLLEKKNYNYNM